MSSEAIGKKHEVDFTLEASRGERSERVSKHHPRERQRLAKLKTTGKFLEIALGVLLAGALLGIGGYAIHAQGETFNHLKSLVSDIGKFFSDMKENHAVMIGAGALGAGLLYGAYRIIRWMASDKGMRPKDQKNLLVGLISLVVLGLGVGAIALFVHGASDSITNVVNNTAGSIWKDVHTWSGLEGAGLGLAGGMLLIGLGKWISWVNKKERIRSEKIKQGSKPRNKVCALYMAPDAASETVPAVNASAAAVDALDEFGAFQPPKQETDPQAMEQPSGDQPSGAPKPTSAGKGQRKTVSFIDEETAPQPDATKPTANSDQGKRKERLHAAPMPRRTDDERMIIEREKREARRRVMLFSPGLRDVSLHDTEVVESV